ncbi:p-loop containing nucleoside triphosphate hydrolase [Venturia nashicola]|nr:p-loop containing nucleoside triphosphate hydrolase [Venturia nashicola]
MFFASSSPAKLLAFGLLAQYSLAEDNPCKSFGCKTDQADNILVDPNGNQYECTETTLTPDDSPMMATCPQNKNQLFSGAWSIIIISNNGAAAPIAYERDFSLSVGPQITTTYIPSVTVPVRYTPVVNSTVSVTYTTNTTLAALTTTVPASTVIPTTTVTPAPVTTTSTTNLLTIDLVVPTASVLKTTIVATASCLVLHLAPRFDRRASITPTVGHISASALAAPTAVGAKFRVKDRRVAFNSESERLSWLQQREDRLAMGLVKRAPDNQTVTVTDTNTAHYSTITTTSTLAAVTATITSTRILTATITPAPIKVLGPATTLKVVTITASTPTRTIVKYAIATNISTKTFTVTVTINTKTTPAAVATSCKAAGGILY